MGNHSHLYNRSAWRRGREDFLRANPLCVFHRQQGRVVLATVVDHRRPHRGDEALFFDRANWQPLCKPCHDAHKQAQEHSHDGLLRGAGLDGRPLDAAHPWHAVVVGQGGGGQISSDKPNNTGPQHPCAAPRNGQGGAS